MHVIHFIRVCLKDFAMTRLKYWVTVWLLNSFCILIEKKGGFFLYFLDSFFSPPTGTWKASVSYCCLSIHCLINNLRFRSHVLFIMAILWIQWHELKWEQSCVSQHSTYSTRSQRSAQSYSKEDLLHFDLFRPRTLLSAVPEAFPHMLSTGWQLFLFSVFQFLLN